MPPRKKLEVGETIDLQAEVVGMEIQQDARSKKGQRKRKITLRFTDGPLKGETLFVRQEIEDKPKSGGGGGRKQTTRKQAPKQEEPAESVEDELDEIEFEDDDE